MPHVRVGDRQRVCGDEACQRERHRRACVSWREEQGDEAKEDRLRRRLRREASGASATTTTTTTTGVVATGMSAPLSEVDFRVARDVVGRQVAVLVEETAKVVVSWARDAVAAQARVMTGSSGGHGGPGARDEIGAQARGP